MCLPTQNHSKWDSYKCPLKEVLERVYKNYPWMLLPADLTGQPTISAKGQRPPTSDAMYGYPPNQFAGWNPYLAARFLNMPPGPSYPVSGPSSAPFYPLYPTPPYAGTLPNPPTNEGRCRSPSDDGQSIEYPTISDFLAELTTADRSHHYFSNYTDYFHQQGYFHLDELADESLTAEHMMGMIHWGQGGTYLGGTLRLH